MDLTFSPNSASYSLSAAAVEYFFSEFNLFTHFCHIKNGHMNSLFTLSLFFLSKKCHRTVNTDAIYARRNKKPYSYVKACNTVVNILIQCEVVFILDNRAEAIFSKLGCIC